MAQRVDAVLGLHHRIPTVVPYDLTVIIAARDADPSFDLPLFPAPVADVAVVLDDTVAVRKYETQLAGLGIDRADLFPGTQFICGEPSQRDDAVGRCGFGIADFTLVVGALTHPKLREIAVEVEKVDPFKAAQLG